MKFKVNTWKYEGLSESIFCAKIIFQVIYELTFIILSVSFYKQNENSGLIDFRQYLRIEIRISNCQGMIVPFFSYNYIVPNTIIN